MKLVSFEYEGQDKVAILYKSRVYPFFILNPALPHNMAEFLNAGEDAMEIAKTYNQHIINDESKFEGFDYHKLKILAPVPHPTSCRDGYAFSQHVATARRNRGLEMIPEFDQYPIFYFTNHNSIIGEGDVDLMPDHFKNCDFELEAAIVIGKKGRNVRAKDADAYIAGYMVMNDLSARALQMEDMKLNLGPTKGKDFATAIGPYMVTPDELEAFIVPAKEGHIGNQHNLTMRAYVNGIQVSEGSLADMDWTFAEIIERASYGVDIYPGDVIGSGTVGTGCFLELNGTGLLNDKNYEIQWLQNGDVVELTIDALGSLKNKMVGVETDYSIMALNHK